MKVELEFAFREPECVYSCLDTFTKNRNITMLSYYVTQDYLYTTVRISFYAELQDVQIILRQLELSGYAKKMFSV